MGTLPCVESVVPPRAVALERPWPNVMRFTWLVSMVATAAAALASQTVGKPAWWIGSDANPAFVGLWVLPFVAPIVAMVAIRRWPWRSPWIGAACSFVTGGFAVGDVGNSPGTAVVMAAIAAATLLASVASLVGRSVRTVSD